jgi:hypothetical protein
MMMLMMTMTAFGGFLQGKLFSLFVKRSSRIFFQGCLATKASNTCGSSTKLLV